MMLSANPFAADHGGDATATPSQFAVPSPGAAPQGVRIEPAHSVARGSGGQQGLAQIAGPGVRHTGVRHTHGPALCPGNELDYTSTAAAMAAVHAVAINPRRSGGKLAFAGLPRSQCMGRQGSGLPHIASSAQSPGLAGQQRPLIRRGLLRGETEVAGVLAWQTLFPQQC